MFHVGQKVVCINSSDALSTVSAIGTPLASEWLEQGRVYTVRAVGRHPKASGTVVWLEEIVRPVKSGDHGKEQGFNSARFRPAVERKTSIEVFQKMLVPTKQKEPV